MHILVADDDPVVTDVVRRYLERDGMQVVVVGSGAAALDELDRNHVDLAILDVMMPEGNGIDVCRRIRAGRHGNLPVIMLTALGEAEDRVLGLESGADDYVAKPFSPRELSLRVQSVLRRSSAAAAEPAGGSVTDGDVTADLAAREVVVGGRAVSTTKREFDLLVFFLRHPDTVFARDELLERVWGWKFGDLSTVTVHVKRLRAKLGESSRIETVWGRGYRWTSRGDTP
ncbi:response regulator transcription factor [Gordonia rhizosphera]|uniref:Putative two-component response regulator n=1 Tax=Gordonia rhizosphera NBRC 16068 TaxID=1108045 RepID=K6WGQ1_9ACTN|nr:response regulator transcription factor [Gordonia rhizosphera]GAB91312.1 putative two-component response regulator [Gordonia rhizosphera NBRC 16068]